MQDYLPMISRLLVALVVGSIIGLERAFHGRPAGLRTHALVSTSSCLLMLLTVYQWDLLAGVPVETIRVDPTRMAQGIMTGIGFLGAGVIMKEKLAVRGLTTAASIWMTAAIGIMVGMGFYSASLLTTLIALIVLGLFGWSERVMPNRHFASLSIRYNRDEGLSRTRLIEILKEHNITCANMSYHMYEKDRMGEYKLTMFTLNPENFHTLSETLQQTGLVREFNLFPSGG
ncbi:MgtC/SapB family protein [Thiohalophilus sp.]|uniref:MgtC/SapB family protein n=1 Tax=Thiohalophilus sp. TaxID=3028392 RepID=UPI002ACE67C9|nr:MgtC/SapB family protein [Thiohalophilus sp.]MDZ7661203.1 MgtC/SapB family protein [Thiohalophilus sp.]